MPSLGYDRRRTQSPRAYEPKSLNARHHRILQLSLLGYSHKQIAESLGCTPATVSTVVNSGLGRAQSALLRAEADFNAVETAKEIRALAPRAIKLISDVLEDESVSAAVRLRAAQDALDRAGFAPVKTTNVNQVSVSLSSSDLDTLKEQALARAQANGLVLDVTPFSEEEARNDG